MDDTMRDSLALLRGRHRGNAKLKKALKLYVVLKVTKAVVDYCEEQQEAQKRRRKRRRVWVEPYLHRRMEQGHYNNLMEELANEAPELFKNYTRTSKALFDEIVERVTPHIKKQTTWWRDPLEPGLRVAITLRFLATGDSYMTLQYSFRVSHNTISGIVPETCRAIVAEYGSEELRTPQTQAEWLQVAAGFWDKWKFPNCIGAIDGKHIRIKNPPGGGSYYYNYKKFYSILLVGICDSQYRFLYVDVGAIGSESDAGVFAHTQLKELVEHSKAHIPPAGPLPGDTDGKKCDYFFVGDDAFALRHYMMKPYPLRSLTDDERIYNYRLSRARRTIENAFGIMANRFRVFHTPICLRPDNVEAVVMGACVLHNMLRNRVLSASSLSDAEDPNTHNMVDGDWRNDPPVGTPLPSIHGRANAAIAIAQRNYLKKYVTSPLGAVAWQNNMI